MALISCPACKKTISDKAESCPNCGHPISPKEKKESTVNVLPLQNVNSMEQNKNNGVGTAGFIVSLIGAVLFWFPVLGVILLLVGFLLSLSGLIVGLSSERNKGLSIAGLIVSILFIVIIIYTTYYIGVAVNEELQNTFKNQY